MLTVDPHKLSTRAIPVIGSAKRPWPPLRAAGPLPFPDWLAPQRYLHYKAHGRFG